MAIWRNPSREFNWLAGKLEANAAFSNQLHRRIHLLTVAWFPAGQGDRRLLERDCREMHRNVIFFEPTGASF